MVPISSPLAQYNFCLQFFTEYIVLFSYHAYWYNNQTYSTS